MKKLLLLTIFCSLCAFNLKSQHHFPKDSAEWKVWVINYGSPYSSRLNVYSFFSDTNLRGLDYQIINNGGGLDSYIREVDSTQKVYFLIDYSDTVSNRLLYDFSKSIGDTVVTIEVLGDTIDWIVVGEGMDTVDFQQRRYLDVKRDGWYNDRWIEGIGSVRGLFAPVTEPSGWFEHWFQLVCFTDKGSGVQYEPFPSNKYNCNTPAHVFGTPEPNLDEHKVEVYPNPFGDKVTLENRSPKPLKFVLYKVAGTKVVEGILSSFEKQILNTEKLEPGLYFVVGEQDGQVFTRKIICGGNP